MKGAFPGSFTLSGLGFTFILFLVLLQVQALFLFLSFIKSKAPIFLLYKILPSAFTCSCNAFIHMSIGCCCFSGVDKSCCNVFEFPVQGLRCVLLVFPLNHKLLCDSPFPASYFVGISHFENFILISCNPFLSELLGITLWFLNLIFNFSPLFHLHFPPITCKNPRFSCSKIFYSVLPFLGGFFLLQLPLLTNTHRTMCLKPQGMYLKFYSFQNSILLCFQKSISMSFHGILVGFEFLSICVDTMNKYRPIIKSSLALLGILLLLQSAEQELAPDYMVVMAAKLNFSSKNLGPNSFGKVAPVLTCQTSGSALNQMLPQMHALFNQTSTSSHIDFTQQLSSVTPCLFLAIRAITPLCLCLALSPLWINSICIIPHFYFHLINPSITIFDNIKALSYTSSNLFLNLNQPKVKAMCTCPFVPSKAMSTCCLCFWPGECALLQSKSPFSMLGWSLLQDAQSVEVELLIPIFLHMVVHRSSTRQNSFWMFKFLCIPKIFFYPLHKKALNGVVIPLNLPVKKQKKVLEPKRVCLIFISGIVESRGSLLKYFLVCSHDQDHLVPIIHRRVDLETMWIHSITLILCIDFVAFIKKIWRAIFLIQAGNNNQDYIMLRHQSWGSLIRTFCMLA
ncbi:hypothetical protein VP01_560g2 [Puccinia sorghi]|uniref:Uncharacterized protein n=1 Tax=Puccinia sorghi TaxID=27349 RepID=A0A0L6UIZ4_9BASI|nr:hypothetical protein VP01_560g2 [Puccinia sorghi]